MIGPLHPQSRFMAGDATAHPGDWDWGFIAVAGLFALHTDSAFAAIAYLLVFAPALWFRR